MIDLKVSRQFFNQWEAKPKPSAPFARNFSRALRKLHVIARNFDWFVPLFATIGNDPSNNFGTDNVLLSNLSAETLPHKPLSCASLWFAHQTVLRQHCVIRIGICLFTIKSKRINWWVSVSTRRHVIVDASRSRPVMLMQVHLSSLTASAVKNLNRFLQDVWCSKAPLLQRRDNCAWLHGLSDVHVG